MHILFDNQILSRQSYGGVVKYFEELMINLKNCVGVEIDIPKTYFKNKSYFSKKNKGFFIISKIVNRIKWEMKKNFDKINNIVYLKRQKTHKMCG